ncbi:MAG: hypothetical protein MK165_13520 [Pirellulaceae bacterium]|nr:hypothetical protein [Pirellulaceae bacterium]
MCYKKRLIGYLLGSLFIAIQSPTTVFGAEEKPVGQDPVSYYRDIRPVLQENCQGCHQPAKRGGGYVMTNYDQLVQGGESQEKAVVAGNPSISSLVAQILVTDGKAAMPKDADPLTEDQIALITRWIEEGADDDTPESAKPKFDMDHPPVYHAPPVITSVDFSSDGKYLAVSGYHEVVLHHADGSGLYARLVGLSERIESAVFSPDSSFLAVTGGSPGRMGELQVWNVEKKELILAQTFGYDTIYGACWSKDGQVVGFGCPDTTVRAISIPTGEQVFFNGAHNNWVLDVVFSVESDHLISVSRDRSMKLYKLDTQRFIDNITSITPGALKGGLHSVDRHPSKDELLSGGADGTPKIYRMIRDKARKIGDDFNLIRAFPAMPGRVFSVAFSADGNRIVAGSSYNTTGEVRIYNYADAKELVKIAVPESSIYAVGFSPDGKTIAAAGYDGYVRLIQAADGTVLKKFPPVEIEDQTVATNR